jgi:hypothetical protein
MSFVTNTNMFRSPSATIFRVYRCYLLCVLSSLLCSNYSFYVFNICFIVLYVLLSILYVLCFCVVLCNVSLLVYSCFFSNCVRVYGPLPLGGSLMAVNKYHIISYHIISYHIINVRSTIEVVNDEILKDLAHCKNSIKFLKFSSNSASLLYTFNQYNGIFHNLNT